MDRRRAGLFHANAHRPRRGCEAHVRGVFRCANAATSGSAFGAERSGRARRVFFGGSRAADKGAPRNGGFGRQAPVVSPAVSRGEDGVEDVGAAHHQVR